MTTTMVLKKARALIVRGWTQGWFARNSKGEHTNPCAKDAVEWCLSGAIIKATPYSCDTNPFRTIRSSFRDRKPRSLPRWNDNPKRKKAEVLALFDRAIAL